MSKLSTLLSLLLLATLGTGSTRLLAAQDIRPGAIMGRWHGTSSCVKAPWNAACNDEVTEYDFVPAAADSTRGTVHAFKIVQGIRDSMGALPIRFAPASQRWDATFSSRRGEARWSFRLQGDTLYGELVLSPDSQVARHVVARRRMEPSPARVPHD